ncbi:PLDc N-terminal domain-containing protein [Paenibacillus sp.]|uniref:PLDc N-terminal domain-containing protein n=1 Tax=Paenibacillus sp. TaxID=58172 RepID=UPI0028AE3C05|nr:PLDc N-terminal domain-containing protein [Paenibacillus sp.]
MLWIILALLLFIVQIAAIIIVEYRRSNKAIVWLIILFLFPLLGFILYYFVAKEYSCHRTLRRKKTGSGHNLRLTSLIGANNE